jgi:hypothetical protein
MSFYGVTGEGTEAFLDGKDFILHRRTRGIISQPLMVKGIDRSRLKLTSFAFSRYQVTTPLKWP